MNIENIDNLQFDHGGINVYTFEDENCTILLGRKQVTSQKELEKLIQVYPYNKLVLECSTKGDKRFSAYGAYITLFGHHQPIEFHYHLSKFFYGIVTPSHHATWKRKMEFIREIKGKKIINFRVLDYEIPLEYLNQWYDFLWICYLDQHPDLVTYLSYFDDYNDIFKGKKSRSCQADSIRKYIKDGRESILLSCQPFLRLLKQKTDTPVIPNIEGE